MFDTILVPTDGSECADAAVDYAEGLAARYGATVHVLSVADVRLLDNASARERTETERADAAEAVCADLDDAGIAAEYAVRTGIPHQEILAYADEVGADLVAMGTHGRTGIERFLLGSVAERVVRLSDAPVLTVTARGDGSVTHPFEEVLLPTDGSQGARAAVDVGLDVADTYGARVHALSVADTTSVGIDVRSEVILDELEETARTAVEAVERTAGDDGPEVVSVVERGHPYRAIRDYVRDNDIDLVVMGTHGRSGLERYMLGSVAEKVVRTVRVPVLTVRAPSTE